MSRRRHQVEIPFDQIVKHRPTISHDIIVDARRLSRLCGSAATALVWALRKKTPLFTDIIGLSAELRVARLASAIDGVASTELASEQLDARGVDIVLWLVGDVPLHVQVKAGPRSRRVESTFGVRVVIAQPEMADDLLLRSIRDVIRGNA